MNPFFIFWIEIIQSFGLIIHLKWKTRTSFCCLWMLNILLNVEHRRKMKKTRSKRKLHTEHERKNEIRIDFSSSTWILVGCLILNQLKNHKNKLINSCENLYKLSGISHLLTLSKHYHIINGWFSPVIIRMNFCWNCQTQR